MSCGRDEPDRQRRWVDVSLSRPDGRCVRASARAADELTRTQSGAVAETEQCEIR